MNMLTSLSRFAQLDTANDLTNESWPAINHVVVVVTLKVCNPEHHHVMS